jgi:transposase
MVWTPTYLTREQIEERRLTGGRLLKAGRWSQAEIARQLGVSRATVSQWAKRLATGGLRALRGRKAPGGPGMTNVVHADQATMCKQLDRGFARLRRRPDLLLSFMHAAGLSVRQLTLSVRPFLGGENQIPAQTAKMAEILSISPKQA